MNSIFATATGSSVSISAESLASARTTLSQAPNFNDDANSTLESPLKSAKSGAAVPVDPEALKMIKRKFADCDDDSNQSPAKKQAGDELDYSSLFRRAGSGKAIKISETALSAAKRTMGADENASTADNNDEDEEEQPTSFTSPMIINFHPLAMEAASSSTTPLRSTPQSSLLNNRRPRFPQPGAAAAGGGGNQFRSPFNSPFRPPIVASPTAAVSSPLLARPTTATNPATPATATASPLSRMCLASPASNSGLTSIASLSPNSRNFTIRVKVTERTGTVVGYGPNGEGRFCCWLSDASELPDTTSTPARAKAATPRLEAEAGGAAADKIATILQFGKVYDIQSTRLSVRRPSHDNKRGIVLFFDEQTQITEVTVPPPAIPRQRHRSTLLALAYVEGQQGEIDLAGIVRSVDPSAGCPQSIAGTDMLSPSVTGQPVLYITLVDQQIGVPMLLPQDYNRVVLKPGDLLAVYRAVIKNISGRLCVMAVRGRTKLLVNPESEDGRVVALQNWSRGGHWAAPVGGGTKLRSIASIQEKMKQTKGVLEREEFLAKGLVVNVDAADEPTIEECMTCGGKLVKDTTPCNCANDRGIKRTLQLEVDISDGTGLIKATATGYEAEALVRLETDEAEGMLSSDGIATNGASSAENRSLNHESSG